MTSADTTPYPAGYTAEQPTAVLGDTVQSEQPTLVLEDVARSEQPTTVLPEASPTAYVPNQAATVPGYAAPDALANYPSNNVPPFQPAVPGAGDGTATTFAITSFVLGIASIVSGWTFFAPIVGLVFGILALRRKAKERTLALWGVWINAIMLALSALMVLGFAAFAALGIFSGIAAGTWY